MGGISKLLSPSIQPFLQYRVKGTAYRPAYKTIVSYKGVYEWFGRQN